MGSSGSIVGCNLHEAAADRIDDEDDDEDDSDTNAESCTYKATQYGS